MQNRSKLLSDPRYYQILALSTLLCFGVLGFEFAVTPFRVIILLTTVLTTQYVAGRLAGVKSFEPKSAIISGLSLCLLLRTEYHLVALFAAVIAVGSKFVIRVRGKHLFNPTNFGIAAVILAGLPAWISPGQWGSGVLIAATVIILGSLVVSRAARSDVTIAYLLFHSLFLFGRAISLGDPFSIPLHQLESGALLIFAFFMISDPKTIPDTRLGRIIFAFLVAYLAHYIRFRLYNPNALLYALVFLSPIVPLIDWLLPGQNYSWQAPISRKFSDHKLKAVPV